MASSNFNIQYAPGYNANPGPQGGQGPYGAVPGAIGLPSPAKDLGAVYPNLTGTTSKASSDILSELSGELSPETRNNIQNQAAQFGVSSGMPLSGLSRNSQLESLGLTTEQLQHQGLGDFLSGSEGISKTQTLDPALQAQIASRNALFRAAPNPGAANNQAQSLFQQLLAQTRGGQGGGRSTASLGPAYAGQGNPPAISAAQPGGVTPAVGPTGFVPPPAVGPTGPVSGDLYGNTSPGDQFDNYLNEGLGDLAGAFTGLNPSGLNSGGERSGGTQFLDVNGQPVGAPAPGSGNAGGDDLYDLDTSAFDGSDGGDYSSDY